MKKKKKFYSEERINQSDFMRAYDFVKNLSEVVKPAEDYL